MLLGRGAVPKPGQKNALPREDATETSVGRVAVPKTGQKNALPREDATETSVGRVAVPKTGQKNALLREDVPEAPVGRVAVPKTGQKPPLPRDNLYPMVLPVHEATGGHAIQTYPAATSFDYQKNSCILILCSHIHPGRRRILIRWLLED